MGEFDKTKKAIGVESMDDKTKTEMFEKFRSAGGKVVKDKVAEEKLSNSSKSKDKNQKKTPSSTSSKQSKISEKDTQSSISAIRKEDESEMGSFLNRLLVKFKCWANKITPFGSDEVLPEFMSELNLEAKNAIMEMKLVANDLLSNPEISTKMIKQMDAINPLFMDTISKGFRVYDAGELTQLLERYNQNPDAPVPISAISAPVYSLFRKLYIIYPFQGTYKKAIQTGYDILQQLEGKSPILYNSKKKKIISEMTHLFDKIFYKLYLIILRNERKNIPLVSYYLENLLGIQDEDKIGKRNPGDPVTNFNTPAIDEDADLNIKGEETETDESEPVFINKEQQYGLSLMSIHNVEQLKKKHDSKNEFNDLPDNDKCFLAYLYFKEFDYEYSFVFTTKKIGYKVTNFNNSKVDNRQNLLNTYEISRSIHDHFRIYVDSVRELVKYSQNPGSNYIDVSKKTAQFEQKRMQYSRNTRVKMKEFLEKARDSLQMLVSDIQGKREIVENPDDILNFDAIEAKKRLNRKPIQQCIMEAYCYSMVFYDRLANGDFYGSIPVFTEEEMKKYFNLSNPEEIDESLVNSLTDTKNKPATQTDGTDMLSNL